MSQYLLHVNGKEIGVELLRREGSSISFRANGQRYDVEIEPVFAPVSHGSAPGVPPSISALPLRSPSKSGSTRSGDIVAPMPGILTKICVNEGQEVSPGQTLAIIEAMKMENNIAAPKDGKVLKIHVAAGSEVQNQQVLLTLG